MSILHLQHNNDDDDNNNNNNNNNKNNKNNNKQEKNCQIIDVAIPEDARVKEKEDEKTEKCEDLARELRRNIYGQK